MENEFKLRECPKCHSNQLKRRYKYQKTGEISRILIISSGIALPAINFLDYKGIIDFTEWIWFEIMAALFALVFIGAGAFAVAMGRKDGKDKWICKYCKKEFTTKARGKSDMDKYLDKVTVIGVAIVAVFTIAVVAWALLYISVNGR